MTVVNDTLYLRDDSLLWRVVGIEATPIVIYPNGPSNPYRLTAVGDTLYVQASNGQNVTIWQVKGQVATKSDFNFDGYDTLFGFTSFNGMLYFIAGKHETGGEIWRLQGTTATFVDKIDAYELSAVGDALYLIVFDGANMKLWKYDNTTFTEVTFPPNVSILIDNYNDTMTAVGDALYLPVTVDGESELWQVNDTTATKIDINKTSVNGGSSDPTYLTAINRVLYVSAFDGTDRELWRVMGTSLYKHDIFSGDDSGEVRDLYGAPHRLYFAATGDLTSGSELWGLDYPLPQVTNDAIATISEVAVEGNILANDNAFDGEILTILGFTQPSHGQLTLSDYGDFIYTPTVGFLGVDSFTYQMSNSHGLTAGATSFVVVKPASNTNVPPIGIAVSPNVTSTYTFTQQGFIVSMQVPVGLYSGTLNDGDTFFMVYTPLFASTDGSGAIPSIFEFAGLGFTLEGYLNSASLAPVGFDTPLLLEIEYPAWVVEKIDPEEMTLFYWDAESSSWASNGIQVIAHDIENHKITIAISHLTEFALFVPATPELFMPLVARK